MFSKRKQKNNAWTWTFHQREYSGLNILGASIAGVHTCFIIPDLKVSFDVGQGLPFALNIQTFLISHGHMDHAAGIPYIISQKALTSQKPGRFYMPEHMLEPMDHIMKSWQRMEGHHYEYDFVGNKAETFYDINAIYGFKIFPTFHRIPSNGYTIFRKNKKLKKEFESLNRFELIELRKKGVELEEHITNPLISFTGDTKIEFLDGCSWLKKSQTLFLEVTYAEGNKTVQDARDWGHIHIDEVLPRLPDLECEKIVLIHLSSRHRLKDVDDFLSRKLDREMRSRVDIFPVES